MWLISQKSEISRTAIRCQKDHRSSYTLLKLSIYSCSLLHFFPHSTQHLGIQIWGQRNEKHDKVAAAWLSRQTINQHAVPPLGPVTSAAPRAHLLSSIPLLPLLSPPQHIFTHSTTSQYTTGFRAKPAVCSGGCMTDCVAAAEPETPQDGASRTRLAPPIQASCSHSVSRRQDPTPHDSTRARCDTTLRVTLGVLQSLVEFDTRCRRKACVRRGVTKNTCESQML